MTLRDLINSVSSEQYSDNTLYQKLRNTKPEYGYIRRIQVKEQDGQLIITNVHIKSVRFRRNTLVFKHLVVGLLLPLKLSLCTPAEARTLDTLIKSQVLYQLSYGCICFLFCGCKGRHFYCYDQISWPFFLD